MLVTKLMKIIKELLKNYQKRPLEVVANTNPTLAPNGGIPLAQSNKSRLAAVLRHRNVVVGLW